MTEHREPEYYQHETSVEGGWGHEARESATIERLFFGQRRLCHCAACVKQRGDEDIDQMVRRGIVAP